MYITGPPPFPIHPLARAGKCNLKSLISILSSLR